MLLWDAKQMSAGMKGLTLWVTSVAAKKASLDYRKLVQELDTRLLHRAGLGAADPG